MRQHITRRSIPFLLLFLSMSVSQAWEQSDITSHQGAIWNLRESNQEAEAKALERHVESTLRSADFLEVRDIDFRSRGVSNSFVVTFPNNVKALMKESDPMFPRSFRSEVAAYRLDRLLNLNFVPLTVIRELNGVQHSVQLLYSNAEANLESGLRSPDNQIRLHDLMAFDYLLGNVDRTLVDDGRGLRNFLIGNDGRLVAIDHARTFDSQLFNDEGTKPDLSKVSQETREKFHGLTAERVQWALQGLVAPAEIAGVLERLQNLKISFTLLPEGPRLPIQQKKVAGLRSFQEVASSAAGETNIYYNAAQVLGRERAGRIQISEIRAFMETVPKPERFLADSVIAQNWFFYSHETRRALVGSELWTSSLKSQLGDFPETMKNAEGLRLEYEQSRVKMCSAVFSS